MSLHDQTISLLKKYNLRANKSLGQNFLLDENVVSEIIQNSEISKDDLVVEIGPGLGTLTGELIKTSAKVIAIELDFKMVAVLQDRFATEDNLEIIQGDVLKLDLCTLIENSLKTGLYKKIKVVANLPYYITTPIIMKLLEDRLPLESMTVMVQKEVADRLVAVPGSALSGAITYAIHYYCKPELLIDVPNNCFIPSPEVESAVIRLNVLSKPSVVVANEALFFRIIKQAFLSRRKTFVNALTGFNGLSKSSIIAMLEHFNIDLNIRGERLTLLQYANIAGYIEQNAIYIGQNP